MNSKTVNGLKWAACVLCSLSLFVQFSAAQGFENKEDGPFAVSFIQLLVNPGFFYEQRIRVFGYFENFETSELYLTKAHAVGRDGLSALVLDIPRSEELEQSQLPDCSEHYVYITGRVRIMPLVAYSVVTLHDVESIKIADGSEGDKFQLCYEAKP